MSMSVRSWCLVLAAAAMLPGYGLCDEEQKVALYQKAAAQGHAVAQFSLGAMYDNGEGVPKDDAQAVAWYRKAAEQGYANAQYNLGLMYDNGEGKALAVKSPHEAG